jgi:trehalose/maltose hydrolase-like predicted phosphorylase
MSGTLDLVQRYYAGTRVSDGVLHFDPRLPSHLEGLSFPMQFRRSRIFVSLTRDRLHLSMHPEDVNRPFPVHVRDEVRQLSPGDHAEFDLSTRLTITE